ncbi:MAG: hypothetical protein NTZ79_11130 [Proteobacteria bacterium]|nr:hypothetical protein [Pseudomonadota bacterium]
MNLLRPTIRTLLTLAVVLCAVQTAAAHPGAGRWNGERDDYARQDRDEYARVLEARPRYLVLMPPPRHALSLPCADEVSGSAARAVAMTRSRARTRAPPRG